MQINLVISEPLLTLEEYAKRTGQTIDSVKDQARRHFLPIVQKEARGLRFVNMVELTQRCLNHAEQQPKHLKTWG